MRHSKIDFLEKRPYTETTHSKTDRGFQAKLGLYAFCPKGESSSKKSVDAFANDTEKCYLETKN